MNELIPRWEYTEQVNASRPERIKPWHEARFGMFVHLGPYSVVGRHEWLLRTECWPHDEYRSLANHYHPALGAPREWAKLAKRSGMKYMVFTARHGDGYCNWDTKQSEFNSVRTGPKRDLVAECVEACRSEGLLVGLYFSQSDCLHPDGGRAPYDPEARQRYLQYNRSCLRELLTNYGTIDILWFDEGHMLKTAEGWESLATNQMVRSLQPNIVINNRSKLPEDYDTPEGSVTPAKMEHGRLWEACMTFNGSSWGHMIGAEIDAWRPRDIVKMLATASSQRGNLVLNIGPKADGSVSPEYVESLESVGRWLATHGEATYGTLDSFGGFPTYCGQVSRKGNFIYFWRTTWAGTEQGLGGYETKLNKVTCLTTGEPVEFDQEGYRIMLRNLPEQCPAPETQVVIYKLEFEDEPVFKWLPTTPSVVANW